MYNKMLGFVVEDLAAGQIPYTLIHNSNEFLDRDTDINISLFYMENSFPCLWPRFARFNLKDTMGFCGSLIATSVQTAHAIQQATRADRYFYIQDLEWKRPWFNETKQMWNSVMGDEQVIKIARSNDHYKEFCKSGYRVRGYVEDFNLEKILEITKWH